jgi:GTP-binding protein
VRSVSKEDAVKLTPAIKMAVETAISYIRDDEIIEVTPKCIRMRKQILDGQERKSRKGK